MKKNKSNLTSVLLSLQPNVEMLNLLIHLLSKKMKSLIMKVDNQK